MLFLVFVVTKTKFAKFFREQTPLESIRKHFRRPSSTGPKATKLLCCDIWFCQIKNFLLDLTVRPLFYTSTFSNFSSWWVFYAENVLTFNAWKSFNRNFYINLHWTRLHILKENIIREFLENENEPLNIILPKLAARRPVLFFEGFHIRIFLSSSW